MVSTAYFRHRHCFGGGGPRVTSRLAAVGKPTRDDALQRYSPSRGLSLVQRLSGPFLKPLWSGAKPASRPAVGVVPLPLSPRLVPTRASPRPSGSGGSAGRIFLEEKKKKKKTTGPTNWYSHVEMQEFHLAVWRPAQYSVPGRPSTSDRALLLVVSRIPRRPE